MVTSSLTALVMALAAAAAPAHDEAPAAICQAAARQPVIVAARQALERDATNLSARFRLADSWSNIGCFADAIEVLQVAESVNPRNEELQTRLRVARSMVSEQTYFENLDRAAQAARLSRANLRCSKLADVQACDDALLINPNDAELLTAKAEALLQSKRPAEAVAMFRRAMAAGRSKDSVAAKLAQAEVQRQAMLATCESGFGDAGRQACQAAWLPGAPDELRVFKRRGALLEADNQRAAALDVYIAASQLPGSDRSIDQSIVSLSEGSGRGNPRTTAARSAALLRLGRVSDAGENLHAARAPAKAPSVAASNRPTAVATPIVAGTAGSGLRNFSNAAEPTRSN